MLNKILPILITIIAVGGAGFAAKTLKGGGASQAAIDAHVEANGGKYSKGVHHVEGEEKTSGYGYFNFRRNFIIPVVGQSRVEALVLLSVSIEMEESKIENTTTREPTIRDAFMKTLLEMSHEGIFNRDITNPDVYNEIQKRLLETAIITVDEGVRSILLVDFARQDQ